MAQRAVGASVSSAGVRGSGGGVREVGRIGFDDLGTFLWTIFSGFVEWVVGHFSDNAFVFRTAINVVPPWEERGEFGVHSIRKIS